MSDPASGRGGTERERSLSDGLVVEPGSRRETHRRHFLESLLFFRIETGIHVPASTRLDGIENRRKLLRKHLQGKHPYGENVRNCFWRTDYVRDRSVPNVGVFESADCLESSSASAVRVAVSSMRSVHLRRNSPRISSGR